MFGPRGRSLRPFDRAASFAANLRSITLNRGARTLVVASALTLSALAQASYSYTSYPEDICATESIYLDGVSPYQEGFTDSGIRYKILVNNGEGVYSSRYSSINPAHVSVRVEFDQPMAAVGALINIAGYSTIVNNSEEINDTSIRVDESGYRGLIADKGGIREITFTTNNGPMGINRIDLRPVPQAIADHLNVFENSSKRYDAGNILDNDLSADNVVLVTSPEHAAKFDLHDDGSFVYEPVKGYEGQDSFSYSATNGMGASVSEPATVTIDVLATNCPPSFTKGSDITVDQDAGPQTLENWAGDISSGPEREAGQQLYFETATDNDRLFVHAPQIDPQGTLTFEPQPYQSGTVTVTVRLHDDGGLENGGVNASTIETFTITVVAKELAPKIEPIFDCAVRQGDALVLDARASVLNADVPVAYSLDGAPEGATINPTTGQIVWRPGAQDSGTMPEFVVRATEMGQLQLSTVTTFHAEVLSPAAAPHVDPIRDIEAEAGRELRTQIKAKTEGTTQFFLATLVAGAHLDPQSGTFTWTPDVLDAGRTYAFSVSVMDAEAPGLCTVKTFSVHVSQNTFAAHVPKTAVALKAKGLQTSGEAAMRIVGAKRVRKTK